MFLDPAKTLEQFGIGTNMIVADLGAGSGFYSLAAARLNKSGSGKVYAIEVQRDLLGRIKDAAEKEQLSHIEYIWANFEKLGGTKLHDHTVDRVIVSNVMFQVEDKPTAVKEIARILKPDGKVLFIDWSESFGGMGPHPDAVFTRTKAIELFRSAGFTEESEIDAGVHHYGIIFKKNNVA
jgi:ubiquinone/menaquinone biosynthesis C-methylase UbiE